MTTGEHIEEQVRNLPGHPGVYQFFDGKGELIYIGKAKDLKKRVASYFSKQKYESYKIKVLVNKISKIRYIVVNNESDALLLENNLVKKYQPRYNIMLKDDKTFPWICIKHEPFPRVFTTRNVVEDGSQYFGPYTSAYAAKVLLTLIRQLYPLRTCKLALTKENIRKKKFKVCLEYHLGNCKGPCEGLQPEEEYLESVRQIREIIKGNLSEVIAYLKTEMKNHADSFRFEQAAQFKQKIEVLSRYQSKSTIVNPSIHDVDVFSIVSDEKVAFVNFLKVVKGAVIQAHSMEIRKKLDESDSDLLAYAVADLRQRIESSATELILPFDLGDYFPKLKITIPQIGDKKKLLDLSLRNARSYRLEKMKSASSLKPLNARERILKTIQADLRLATLPLHMECFDISHIQGSNAVASCVVFRNGKPAKKEYRHFNIRSNRGKDDYASMEEVVYRRYKRMLEEERPLPHLVVIDGGKGQLNAAVKSLNTLGIRRKLAVIGIAKRLEEIFFPEDPVPLYIDKGSESLKLIQFMRNEAHRFGISFHRQKRSGSMTTSDLSQIPGIGDKTIEKLYGKFKSTEGIIQASVESLAGEIGWSRARKIRVYFQKEKERQ